MMTRRRKLTRIKWMAILIFIGYIAVTGVWNTFQVGITHIVIFNTPLANALHGKTIVHLTDLHMNGMGMREQKVLKLLDTLKPDLVFLTGDYITWKGNVHAALDFLGRIHPPMGAFAVVGDYDVSRSRPSCLFCHEKNSKEPATSHRVKMFNNTGTWVQTGKSGFYVYGATENDQENETIKNHLSTIEDDGPLIVLSHNPMKFDLMDRAKNGFMMAGDTHGGQVPLPSFLWGMLGYEKNRKYNAGLFQDGKKQMYVNRGIGYSHLPIRLFYPPEIVVYDFQPVPGEAP